MKTMNRIFALGTVVCGIVFMAACSKESMPQQPEEVLSLKQGTLIPIAISASGISANGTNSGAYTASGAFSSNGSWSESYSWNGNKYHSKIDFTDANGSFEMHVSGNLAFSSATDGSGVGTWTIKKCSGVYAGMDGNGNNTIVISNWNAATGGDVYETFDGEIDL